MPNYIVEMKAITKRFSGVQALSGINFNVKPGEVHVLLGENGAGKSTLMKILCGVYSPTSGTITMNGNEYESLSPKQSVENGVSIIYQELSVINELSIAENIFVGKLPTKRMLNVVSAVDFKYMEERTKELLEKVGLKRSPTELVENLSISEKQLVEIAKSIAYDCKVLIMDEPTSSLTIEETKRLFVIIEQLKKEGVGIIYISHKLKELREIGDRITILKDGTYVGTRELRDIQSEEELVAMMVGRELKSRYLAKPSELGKEVIFEVQSLTRKDGKIRDISFELRKGEILGFAGLIGAGRTELMEALVGSEQIKTGSISLFGEKIILKTPYDAVKKGMALITENRRESGIFQNFEIWRNVSLSSLIKTSAAKGLWGLLNRKHERNVAEVQKESLRVKAATIDQNITELSGGNQQKVIIGRWLAADSSLLIFDEPTKGIDVGAKSEIYLIMRELANQGKGVIVVSSELPELLSVCDRIIVMRDGEINGEFNNKDATEENIMLAATH